jgi:uncharacterized membrane protein
MSQAVRAIPDPGAAAFDLSRLRGFSDGVFAIAVTVTVLQLVVPDTDLGNSRVLDELLRQWPIFLSLVIGFIVVGYYWLNHHRLFELLDKADGTVVWLNHLLLLFVVFVPFPTEILGLYHEYRVSWIFFHVTGFAVGVMNSALWFYATSEHRLVPSSLDARALRIYRWRSASVPLAFLLAAGVAFFSSWASLVCLTLAVVGRPIVRAVLGPMPPGEAALEDAAQAEEDDAAIGSPDVAAGGRGSSLTWLLGARAPSSLERLIAFTDGVYAIAITLLGFQFLPPDTDITSNQALTHYLFERELAVDLYVGYFVGFVTVGLFWVTHHRYFVVIRRQDAGLRMLSLVHLFFIALLPDATEFLSVHHGVPGALAYYALVAGMASLTISILWEWASWRHHLIDRSLSHRAIRTTRRLGFVLPLGFGLSIPLAFVVGQWAQLCWLAAFLGLRAYQHLVATEASS